MWVEVQRATAAKRPTVVEGWGSCGLAAASSLNKTSMFADAASMGLTGEDDKNSSVARKLQVRVFIAQGLSIQGCGSGPRLVFQHRRGPLSVCRSTISADPTKLPRYPLCSKGPWNAPGTDPAGMVNGRRGRCCRDPKKIFIPTSAFLASLPLEGVGQPDAAVGSEMPEGPPSAAAAWQLPPPSL